MPNRIMAPFRYFGGKGNLVKQIVPLLPKGKVYVEPFCGAASVYWHLPDGAYPNVVLNDIDQNIYNLFKVLQDRKLFEDFWHKVVWTPYSLDMFRDAMNYDSDDPVHRAWAFYVRQNQGFGGKAKSESECYWGKTFVSARNMADTSNSWRGRMKLLIWWHDRLTKVQIDNRDALQVIEYWDTSETVFYVDPPYMQETRKSGEYEYEIDNNYHKKLLELLKNIKGKVVLSGYNSDLYNDMLSDWQKIEIHTYCHAAGRVRTSNLLCKGNAPKRTEVIWMNFCKNKQKSLLTI